MIATLFITFIVLLILEMPVSFSLLISTVVAMEIFSDIDLFAISAKTWEKLSDDQKQIIQEEAAKAVEYERSIWAENTEKAIAALLEEGVEFNDVDDLDAFREATSSLWTEYEEEYQNGLIEEVLALAD